MNENGPSTSPRLDGAEPGKSFIHSIRAWLRGIARRRNGDSTLRESVEELIGQHNGGEGEPIGTTERAMFLNLLNFGDLRVDDVMVPRADIVSIEQSAEVAEVARVMREAGHSRLPVYRGTLDEIAGMVHVRDLLHYWDSTEPFALDKITRRLLFVPPSMKVRDLLLQMRAARIHMAMVVDEFGGTDGLVTIEDLVEEIVGEIHDEHDVGELPALVDQPNGVIEADARVAIEDLEAHLGCSLVPEDREEHIDTLAGLVFSLVGRVPVRGELIDHPAGLQFEVVDAEPRRIRRLRIHRIATPASSA